MMGHHARSEALFCCFRLDEHVPENHLLRSIDNHVSFEFVRELTHQPTQDSKGLNSRSAWTGARRSMSVNVMPTEERRAKLILCEQIAACRH